MKDKALNLFVNILEKIAINSSDCREAIKNKDTNKLLTYLDQRSSLLNIYKTVQIKINQDYELEDRFKSEVSAFFTKMAKFDEEVLSYLETEKEKTKIEIGEIFKNKQSFKGYNLSSTK